MTEKTKRIILIAAGVLLCAVLVVGIVSRLAAVPMPIDPAIPDDTPNTKDPVVNISDPEVKVDTKTDGERHDPGRDADSSGTEQTIQGTPTKPDAPEHPGKVEQTEVKPQPTEPAGGSTNDAGQVYVPGFGYVKPSGPNDGGTLNDMYENGNKIGIMGG